MYLVFSCSFFLKLFSFVLSILFGSIFFCEFALVKGKLVFIEAPVNSKASKKKNKEEIKMHIENKGQSTILLQENREKTAQHNLKLSDYQIYNVSHP